MTPSRCTAVTAIVAALLTTGCAAGDGNSDDAAPTTSIDTTSSNPAVDSTSPPTTTVATTSSTRPLPLPTTTDAGPSSTTSAPPRRVVPFTDAAALAGTLGAAETALADPSTPPDDFVAWARIHQQAYRDLVVHPGWRAAAREAVPSRLRHAFDLNLLAGTELRRLTTPQDGLPDWQIIAPPPIDELRRQYDAAEAEFDVPWNILAAIHLVETRFGRIEGDSPAGARGPMQFMPSTWEAYGEGDIEDVGDSIRAAARYLVAHGAPDDLERALFAYNHSDHYVTAVLAHAEAMARFGHYLPLYHQWRVYYRTVDGDVLLDDGYGS